jgi:hypothetical protein
VTSESAPCGSNGKGANKICRDPGSNRGPLDLQSNALPTELSRLILSLLNIIQWGSKGERTHIMRAGWDRRLLSNHLI